MGNKKKKIAIITARGGSKRIKNKNLINFYGKPLISYSIKVAKKTNIFDKIYVTTDSSKIKQVAEYYGAIVPYLRSKKLSNDFTGTREVVVDFLKKMKLFENDICCIYPTAPMMRSSDLLNSYKQLPRQHYIFSSNATLQRKGKIFSINKKNIITKFIKHKTKKKRYMDAGQFYWGTANTWLNKKNIVAVGNMIKKIPKKYAHDLNNPADLKILKMKFKKIR